MSENGIMAKVGSLSFLIGILIALIFGIYQAYTLESAEASFFSTNNGGIVAWILVAIGVIIGLLTVFGKGTLTAKEVPGFLFAGIALVVMGGVFQSSIVMGIKPILGSLLAGVSLSLSIFVAPTVGILAVMAIWAMGKDV
jgi:hypothetical protein